MSGFNISQGSLLVEIVEDSGKKQEELAELISEEEQKESDGGPDAMHCK
jgi:hypothetical protein